MEITNKRLLNYLSRFGLAINYDEENNSAYLYTNRGYILTKDEHLEVITALMNFLEQVTDAEIEQVNKDFDREPDYRNPLFIRTDRRNKWKEGYVFVYKELAYNNYRFGFTKDLEIRKRSLINASPVALDFIIEINMENIEEFKEFLEEKFSIRRLPESWFNLLEEDINYIRKGALQDFRALIETRESRFDEEFTCPVCQTHVTSKRKTSYFKCNHCNGRFDTKNCVLEHLDMSHGIANNK
ncbi:hypothetical protein [Cytobacillus firmus]|uniref:C2H2-type domain-containing protein n=1 Tax=Cytobacillus firmus DS1 TaxID=1307436 RepID=W7KRF4_CYTFI|nr:hypothetical protein [Cytobacillus firmus]EWG08708.1 hypothetical protein PBF_22759 [Cytobacillus firmus DS1]